MKIRIAKKEDINSLIELWEGYEKFHLDLTQEDYMKKFLQTNKNAIPEMKKYFKKKISSEDTDILIVEDSKKIVGFILLSIYDSSPIAEVKKYGHIGYFFVKENLRGKGIGGKIYKKSLEWFNNKNVKRISLEVNFLNERAIKFYRKLGFKKFEINMIKDFD
jgi:ribosomal protein S18 acetylase RimI-like enzyme